MRVLAYQAVIVERVCEEILALLDTPSDRALRASVFAWLIANDRLQLKFAFPTHVDDVGIFHEKIGVFDFNDVSFRDAMAQLERWYDIEVVYEKGIPTNVELNGKMTKDITLNELVGILEKIGVKCRLEGRKLLIQS